MHTFTVSCVDQSIVRKTLASIVPFYVDTLLFTVISTKRAFINIYEQVHIAIMTLYNFSLVPRPFEEEGEENLKGPGTYQLCMCY